jgi:hypothetical protein
LGGITVGEDEEGDIGEEGESMAVRENRNL